MQFLRTAYGAQINAAKIIGIFSTVDGQVEAICADEPHPITVIKVDAPRAQDVVDRIVFHLTEGKSRVDAREIAQELGQ